MPGEWNGEPPAGTADKTRHILAFPDGDEFIAEYSGGAWHPHPSWGGPWGHKEVEPHELAAVGCRYVRPLPAPPEASDAG